MKRPRDYKRCAHCGEAFGCKCPPCGHVRIGVCARCEVSALREQLSATSKDLDTAATEVAALRGSLAEVQTALACALASPRDKERPHFVPPALEPLSSRLLRVPMFKRFAAIYFLLDGDEIVYVGQSFSVVSRVAGHMLYKKVFDRALCIAVPERAVDAAEGALIRLFKPKYCSGSPAGSATDGATLEWLGFRNGMRVGSRAS